MSLFFFFGNENEFFGSCMISSKPWGNHERILICFLDYSHGLFFIWIKNALFPPAPVLPQHRLSQAFLSSEVKQVRCWVYCLSFDIHSHFI